MASCWTNKSAILRDLSKAQGRYVPGGVEQAVGANEKPPALDFTEETEEEFFKNCTAGGDFLPTPDLGLIKEMLNMVKDVDLSSGDEESIEITKLNPHAAEFKPKLDMKSNSKTAKLKKKLDRNVALTSLLTSIANKAEETENIPNNSKELKLLKPNDFIESANKESSSNGKGPSLPPVLMFITKPVASVDPIIKEKSPKKGKKGPRLSPVMMFKKKSINVDSVDIKESSPKGKKGPSLSPVLTFKKKSVSNASFKVDDKVSVLPQYQNTEYKPSVRANQYYQKYVEQAQLAEKRKDDIWTRAEKIMKEVEVKRKLKAANITDADSTTDGVSGTEAASGTDAASVTGGDSVTDASVSDVANVMIEGSELSSEEASKLDIVLLPQHRHLLTGECVVCAVMKQYRTKNIEENVIETSDS